jgi:hypothetical protein
VQGHRQQPDRLFAWGVLRTPLQIADAMFAHLGALGQFLLRQPGDQAMFFEQSTKRRGWCGVTRHGFFLA